MRLRIILLILLLAYIAFGGSFSCSCHSGDPFVPTQPIE